MSNIIHIIANDEIENFLADCNIDFLYDDRDKIENLENFEFELERQGLMTEQLKEFIENYMRFDNG